MKTKLIFISLLIFLSMSHLVADIYDEYNPDDASNQKNYFMSTDFDEIIHFDAIMIGKISLDDKAIDNIIKKIKSYKEKKKEILISIIGYTDQVSDDINESKKIAMNYASGVRDDLVDAGVDNSLIILQSRGNQDPAFSDATQKGISLSSRVMVSLYVKKDNDLDHDGVVNDLDKCPNTIPNVKVSEVGCKFSSVIMLLDNNKDHNAILLTTGSSQVEIDKPNTYVVVKSPNEMSAIKDDMSEEEKRRLFGDVIENEAAKSVEFTLYFNNLVIAENSKQELKKMLNELSKRSDSYIKIIGHTDTKGSFKTNDVLSKRRAQKVQELIDNANIRYLQVDTEGYGEYDLAVKTADDVVESSNRRAEIFIH